MSKESKSSAPRVAILMGSRSDLETMNHAGDMLAKLDIPYEVRILSAHRAPDALVDYVGKAEERGVQVIIAGAGGAAHLAGVIAAKTTLPVLGVPMQSKALQGMDSLLIHCANAERHSGGHLGHWGSRRCQCRLTCCSNFSPVRSRCSETA